MSEAPTVEVFFDPMCPWAWQAAVWLDDVRRATGLELRWRFFSLEEVNRPDDRPHPWERPWAYGWSPLRVAALLRRRSQDDCERWYRAFGTALHEQGRDVGSRALCEALAEEAGFGAAVVAEALDDPTTTDEVRADHQWLVEHEGGFGVPTLLLPGRRAFFGPVITPAPRGEAAVRLWELVERWVELPHLYEARTPKTAEDLAHIGRSFAPYLAGRRWQTIQKEAP